MPAAGAAGRKEHANVDRPAFGNRSPLPRRLRRRLLRPLGGGNRCCSGGFLESGDLVDSAWVALLTSATSTHHFTGQFGPDDPATQGEHVGVVVLHRLVSGVSVMGQGRSDPVEFVGGDQAPAPEAADQDPPLLLVCRALPHRQPRRYLGSRAGSVENVPKVDDVEPRRGKR